MILLNTEALKSIVKKDVTEVSKSTQMMIPMVGVPLVILVAIPALIIISPRVVTIPSGINQYLYQIIDTMPQNIKLTVSGFDRIQLMIYLLVNYLFGPLFLVIPLMVSSIMAANSFAGEKEKKTIEGLLFAPITDTELFLGKSLAAFIPSFLIAVIGFVLYTIVVDILAYPLFGYILLPNTLWLLLVLFLAPTISFFGLAVTVIVSSKARGFQEAQQIAGVVVLPIVAMVIMESVGLLFLSNKIILILGTIFLALDIILIKIGIKLFKGEKILEKTK